MNDSELSDEFREAAELEAQYPIYAGTAALAYLGLGPPRPWHPYVVFLEPLAWASLVTVLYSTVTLEPWAFLAAAFGIAVVTHWLFSEFVTPRIDELRRAVPKPRAVARPLPTPGVPEPAGLKV